MLLGALQEALAAARHEFYEIQAEGRLGYDAGDWQSPSMSQESRAPAAASADMKTLETRVREVENVNERVMAQNVILLHEVEVMQRQISALRQEKAAMAEQLRRAIDVSE